jgi:hypothetical protein
MKPGEIAAVMAQITEMPTLIFQCSQQTESFCNQMRVLRREANETLDALNELEARLHGTCLQAERLEELRAEQRGS